jgi:hypothetical protein
MRKDHGDPVHQRDKAWTGARRRYFFLGFLSVLLLIMVTAVTAELVMSVDSAVVRAEPAPFTPEFSIVGLEEYRQACQELEQRFQPANVVYNPELDMAQGDAAVVDAAAVILDTTLPPEELLRTAGGTAEPVRVSCRVQAQLRGASEEFLVDPEGWESQDFYPATTVSWSWFVKPRVPGDHELLLDVKPVVAVNGIVDTSDPLYRSPAPQTKTFVTSVHVTPDPNASATPPVAPPASAALTTSTSASPNPTSEPGWTGRINGWTAFLLALGGLLAALATLKVAVMALAPKRSVWTFWRKPAPVKNEEREEVKTP